MDGIVSFEVYMYPYFVTYILAQLKAFSSAIPITLLYLLALSMASALSISLWTDVNKVQVLQSVERKVVNPVHRVLSPYSYHLHKVLNEKDGESSLLRERIKTDNFSIPFPIWKPYLFLKIQKVFITRKNSLKSLESLWI